jgi:DNA-binding LacI/PurR family transcriptional regulator
MEKFSHLYRFSQRDMKKKNITIHDIAKKLDITASTVSRALNNNPRISASTRELVKKTAMDLNYQPNTMASNLRRGKGNTIGLIVPRINRFFFADTISGIESVTTPAGFNLIICQSNESFAKEVENINTLIENRVDGIIISVSGETRTSGHLKKVLQNNIPLLQYDRVIDELDISKVVNDNFEGAYQATTHLIEQGYRKIAHLAGPLQINIYNERYEGFKKALGDHKIPFRNDLVFKGVLTYQFGRDLGQKIFELEERPDAVFSAGDFAALGLMEYLKDSGLRIPNDMAIAGFANEQFTEYTDPGLTTCDQFAYEMGSMAAKLLLDEIGVEEKNRLTKTITIKPKLIIRNSSLRK